MRSKRRIGEELLGVLAIAIVTELIECDYQNPTLEGVARRVETDEPVLCRRFTTRSGTMTFAAVCAAPAFLTELQGSTPLRKDFQNLVSALQRWMRHIGIVTMLDVLSEVGPQQHKHLSVITAYPEFVAVTRFYRVVIARGGLNKAVLDPLYIRFLILLLLAGILTRGKIGKTELVKLAGHVVIPQLTTFRLHPAAPHQDN